MRKDAKKNKIAIISEMTKRIQDSDAVQMEKLLPKDQKIKDALNALKRYFIIFCSDEIEILPLYFTSTDLMHTFSF